MSLLATRIRDSTMSVDFWPNTVDNLVWSKDGIIAVGGGNHTSLFVPPLKSIASSDKRWEKIDIKTSGFTEDEVKLQLPFTWKNFSIGEEMSEAFVHSLDWSPPGLGKHKRCVLAVLTSNHILSIWECIGRPETASDWVRSCIVNEALDAHFNTSNTPHAKKPQQDRVENEKSRTRIRAFAWSHSPPSKSSSNAFRDDTTEFPYLAVSNDRGHVLIVKLQSPHDILSPESQSWQLSVLADFTVNTPPSKSSPLAACMPANFQWRSTFVDQLAWSPWSIDNNGKACSILALTSQASLQCKTVKILTEEHHTTVETGKTLRLLEDESNTYAAGSMKWAPKLKNNKDAFLVYPTRKLIYIFQAQPDLSTGFDMSTHELNSAWNEISALAFTMDENDAFSLEIVYHMDPSADHSTKIPLPYTYIPSSECTPWQSELIDEQHRFSNINGLGGHAITKSYGLGVSPVGDMVAVNASFHPTDGVEYTTHSEERSYMAINPVKEDISDVPTSSPSHAHEITSEAVLFHLQSITLRQPDNNVDPDLYVEQILQLLNLNNAPAIHINQAMITEDIPIETIVRQVRQSILFNKDSITSRTRQLVKYAKDDVPKSVPLDATVVLRIVTEVARLPHFIADASPLSRAIMQIHCMILAKLQARAGNADSNDHIMEEEEIEKCEVCNSNITFESLKWARCANNHIYSRCTLSFLAIQTPGTAKACYICNAQYMNEHIMPWFKNGGSGISEHGKVDDNPKQGVSGQEPLLSLARILFAACDRCICCGGKFTG